MKSNNANRNEPHGQPTPKEIVCFYAMCDESMYRELQAHLVLWHTKGHIRWLEVSAGADVEQILLAFVQQADLILLFISSSFFATSMLHRMMESALAEWAKRGVLVVPILARAFDWKESACGSLKAFPDNELPIAEWEHKERAYENIRAGLVRLIPGLAMHMTSLAIRPKHFQACDLPKGYVARPKVFDEIKHLLLNHKGNRTTAITIALRGAGGFGKTTLAIALCHDPEIQAAFPDGILWVGLGEQPLRSLDVLNGVLTSLGASLSGAITLEEVQDHWRTTLQGRVCLLVIDDIWQAVALEPLLEGGPQCVRLVTTRNDQVLPEAAIRVWVDAMEPEEAIAVLCRGLPEEIQQEMYQPKLSALTRRLGCWPLLLTLAHGLLVAQVRHGRRVSDALDMIEQAYEARGVLAFDSGNLIERQRAVKTCIEVSLRHLEEFTTPQYPAVQRYLELAVFPEDTAIPLTVLRRFWYETGSLASWEVDALCIHLHDLSLLLTCDLGTETIRLHDVMHSYLLQRAGSLLASLHERFLNIFQQILGLKRWVDLPPDEYYLWQHLVLHLCAASRSEDLQTTLTDLGYLAHKVLYSGVSALENDFLMACTFLQAEAVESAQLLFVSLQRSIMRLSHLLRQLETPAEMGGFLLSHLGFHSPFAVQRTILERELPRPFLMAWHPLPSEASSALIRTLSGHTASVWGCAMSPDGCFIVSASQDKTLKVWDAATGVERQTLTGHAASVTSCVVSPDGRFIVSASGDTTLKVWDFATGVELRTLTGHTTWVWGCAMSPDGRFIVSASSDNTLKVWDFATGVELRTLTGHTNRVRGCAMSPDGRFIVSASGDNALKVWDFVTGVELRTLTGHTTWVYACAVSPDGRFIVSAARDHTLKVWDAATGVELRTLTGHTNSVSGCAISPDGHFIVSTSVDDTLKMWDFATGVERRTLTGHTASVWGCAVSPDGRFIVSASVDHTLKVWDATIGVERRTLTGHTASVWGCAVSPDGRFIVSASVDHTLKVWDAATGVERRTLTGHAHWIYSCAVSPDSHFIVSASRDHTLKVWDAATGVELRTLIGHTDSVWGCAVSPDGRFIVSASWDNTLKVWDVATGVELRTLTGHTNSIYGCTVSPDGRFIVSASWDNTLKVWDAVTGIELRTLTGHTNSVSGCAISPDGHFIVSTSWDHTLKVWDAATGIELRTLTGHTNSVNGCAVSPDGRWIISASGDGTLKVWDAQTERCVLTFPVDEALLGCAFHPDGEHLVVCGEQGVFFLRLVV